MTRRTHIVIRCMLCSKEKSNHPEACKPIWMREVEEGPRHYERLPENPRAKLPQ